MSGYSEKHMLAFIHVPKNAGTSIRQQLSSLPDWKNFDDLDKLVRKRRDPAFANHFPAYMIDKLIAQSGADIPFLQMVKFMVVRNPWERMVSLYNHRMKKLDLWYQGEPRNTEEDKKVAREGFIPWLLTTPSAGDSVLTRTAQCSWARDAKGRFAMDFVLRYEDLDANWDYLLKNRKLPCGPLPHRNKGPKDSAEYREYYNKEAREHVEKYFAEDIRRFHYDF